MKNAARWAELTCKTFERSEVRERIAVAPTAHPHAHRRTNTVHQNARPRGSSWIARAEAVLGCDQRRPLRGGAWWWRGVAFTGRALQDEDRDRE